MQRDGADFVARAMLRACPPVDVVRMTRVLCDAHFPQELVIIDQGDGNALQVCSPAASVMPQQLILLCTVAGGVGGATAAILNDDGGGGEPHAPGRIGLPPQGVLALQTRASVGNECRQVRSSYGFGVSA